MAIRWPSMAIMMAIMAITENLMAINGHYDSIMAKMAIIF
jgi:hypothetical protein